MVGYEITRVIIEDQGFSQHYAVDWRAGGTLLGSKFNMCVCGTTAGVG